MSKGTKSKDARSIGKHRPLQIGLALLCHVLMITLVPHFERQLDPVTLGPRVITVRISSVRYHACLLLLLSPLISVSHLRIVSR